MDYEALPLGKHVQIISLLNISVNVAQLLDVGVFGLKNGLHRSVPSRHATQTSRLEKGAASFSSTNTAGPCADSNDTERAKLRTAAMS